MILNILLNRGTERDLCVYLAQPSLRGKKTQWQIYTLKLLQNLDKNPGALIFNLGFFSLNVPKEDIVSK